MSARAVQLPRWRCHKVVGADKIVSIVDAETDAVWLCFAAPGGGLVITVSREWADRFKPEPGGYFVVYQDGYESYSPAKAFEEGYTRIAPTPADTEQQLKAAGIDIPSLAPGYGGEP